MGKKDEKILEHQYTIEVLEEELSETHQEYTRILQLNNELHRENGVRQSRIVELINENDRLTMTYEPYRPEGDEHEGLEFYGLIDEVELLNSKLREYILERDYYRKLYLKTQEKPTPKTPLVKNDRWWNFSVELWPGAWGLNYYRYDWKRSNGTAREGNIQIGPFGFSWNREPKR